MNRFYTIVGGLFGFLGVGFGAFGAHGLKGLLSPEMVEIFKTGVFYQLIHALAILSLAINGGKFDKACLLFTAGVLLFSFSLYSYSITGIKYFAIITPLGGGCFLAGWVIVVVGAMKAKE